MPKLSPGIIAKYNRNTEKLIMEPSSIRATVRKEGVNYIISLNTELVLKGGEEVIIDNEYQIDYEKMHFPYSSQTTKEIEVRFRRVNLNKKDADDADGNAIPLELSFDFYIVKGKVQGHG